MTQRELENLARELDGTDEDFHAVARRLGLDAPGRVGRRLLTRYHNLWQCQSCQAWTRESRCRRCVGSDGPSHCPSGLVLSDSFRVNYHTIGHDGEHLPSIYAIPRPWREKKDTKAEADLAEQTDLECYTAIQRWKRHHCVNAFREVLVYSLRWLTVIADSVNKLPPNRDTYPRDWGDAIWICVGAAFDTIRELPHHDPADWGDDIELHPDGQKYRNHRGKFMCQPYVRYVRDAAQRAVDQARTEYKKLKGCGEACRGDSLLTATKMSHISRGLQSEVEDEVWSKELLELSHNSEDTSLSQPIFLDRQKWINHYITGNSECDKLHRAVLETSMLHIRVNEEGDAIPTMRHDEIADEVFRRTGIRRHATTIGRILESYRKEFAAELGLEQGKVRRAKSQQVRLGQAG